MIGASEECDPGLDAEAAAHIGRAITALDSALSYLEAPQGEARKLVLESRRLLAEAAQAQSSGTR